MLNPKLADLLKKLKLHSFANSLTNSIDSVYSSEINFEEALIDACESELLFRNQKTFERLIRLANLRYPHASIKDINFDVERSGLTKQSTDRFAQCGWINCRRNINILGPTGIGKTWIACAFAAQACSKGYKTKFYKCWDFIELLEQSVETSDGKLLINKLNKYDLIVIDDFGLNHIPSNIESALLDFIDTFSLHGSLLITSQFPHDLWYEKFNEPTIADAILDRIIHNSYVLEISGASLRKSRSPDESTIL